MQRNLTEECNYSRLATMEVPFRQMIPGFYSTSSRQPAIDFEYSFFHEKRHSKNSGFVLKKALKQMELEIKTKTKKLCGN